MLSYKQTIVPFRLVGFGSNTQTNANPFGQNQQSMFGKPATGFGAATTSTFGQPQNNSLFSGQQQPSLFQNANTSFGAAPTTQSGFGKDLVMCWECWCWWFLFRFHRIVWTTTEFRGAVQLVRRGFWTTAETSWVWFWAEPNTTGIVWTTKSKYCRFKSVSATEQQFIWQWN